MNIHILVNTCTFPVIHLGISTTAWIKALCNRVTKICSNQKLLDNQTKKTLPWNGFPNYVSKPLLGRLKSNSVIPIPSSS